jgi:hypothetical protein
MDDTFHLLVALGAEINLGTKTTPGQYTQADQRHSLLDWVRNSLMWVEERLIQVRKETPPEDDSITETGWQGYCTRQRRAIKPIPNKLVSTFAALKEKKGLTNCLSAKITSKMSIDCWSHIEPRRGRK